MRTNRLALLSSIAMAAALAACGKSPDTLTQECNRRSGASCYELGEKYLAGAGVTEDTDRAAQLFELACEAREARGCDKARQMFEEACDGGDAVGCTNLGRVYLDGFGVPQDSAKAAEFYERACNLEHAISCSNLAMLYADGNGVAPDPARAAALYAKACQGGFEAACEKASQQQ